MRRGVVETAVRGTGLLADFNTLGVLGVADVNVALTLARLSGDDRPENALAAALAVRALRAGSVCVDLATLSEEVFDVEESRVEGATLTWPEPSAWVDALRSSPMVGVEGTAPTEDRPRPLRLVGSRLYLDRYFGHEESVRTQLLRRRRATPPAVDPQRLGALLDELFDRSGLAEDEPNWPRIAAATCVLHWVSVIAGGPGTGKTTTVAKVLAALQALHEGRLRITLTAPTGKAAARLEEAVRAESARLPEHLRAPLGELGAATLHRVLGWRPGTSTRFRHDAAHPLPWDVLVVDEMSMVSLPLMARLLEATRSGTRVILVGDPDQLTSVEAGAVLADVTRAESTTAPVPADDPRLRALVEVRADDRDGAVGAPPHPGDGPPAGEARSAAEGPAEGPVELRSVVRGVVELTHTWRFGAEIGQLAAAVRAGDADAAVALLRAGGEHLAWVETDLATSTPDLTELRGLVQRTGERTVRAARAGESASAVGAVEEHRVLCAHRSGPFGVSHWSRTVEGWLAEAVPGYGEEGEWYLGRPLLVVANDPETGLYNGDTGVVVQTPDGPQGAFARGSVPRLYPLIQLDAVQSLHAMTVHKAQGSQFRQVTFVLPGEGSALLTRELLYTALTRARDRVQLLGTEAALRQAVARPVNRASGLRQRL